MGSSQTDIPLDFALAKIGIHRRGRERERQKTVGVISKTTTLHVHYACLYISLPVFARLQHENA